VYCYYEDYIIIDKRSNAYVIDIYKSFWYKLFGISLINIKGVDNLMFIF